MKSNKKNVEHENHERWLVSYADFITLLFAFFVVLYATSNADFEKQKKFESSVRSNLKLNVGGNAAKNETGPEGRADIPAETYQTEESSPASKEIQKTMAELNNPIYHANSIEDLQTKKEDLSSSKRELISKLRSGLAHIGSAKIRTDALGVRVSLAASSYFHLGSAKIRSDSLGDLNKIAASLKGLSKRIIIEGHTDNMPIDNEQFPSNWDLAATRATTVVRYLIKVHGIEPSLLVAASYADQKPVAPNDTDFNKSQNRRIDILILNDDK